MRFLAISTITDKGIWEMTSMVDFDSDIATYVPATTDIEHALDCFRAFTHSLGDYVEGCQAQKDAIGFWLPRFQKEFESHGVAMSAPDRGIGTTGARGYGTGVRYGR